jgi:hypothetical protein
VSDLGIQELAPGRYDGVVDKVEYSGKSDLRIIITYKIETPNGIRRLKEKELIRASASSANHFRTAWGLARVRDILRIKGLTLDDAEIRSLPALLEGTELKVVTRNNRVAGFNTPIVVRVEKP